MPIGPVVGRPFILVEADFFFGIRPLLVGRRDPGLSRLICATTIISISISFPPRRLLSANTSGRP